MSAKAKVTIELVGGQKPLAPFNSIVIHQSLDRHHKFEIRFPVRSLESSGSLFLNKSKDFLGKVVKISLDEILGKKKSDHFFKGIVTSVAIEKNHASQQEVVLHGEGPSVMTDDIPNVKSFSEMSLSDIVGQVFEAYPTNLLPVESSPKYSEVIPYVVQYRETDFQFIRRLAARYGEWMYYDGEKLKIGIKPTDETDLIMGKDLYNFEVSINARPNAFEFTAYDYVTDKPFNEASKGAKVNGLDKSFGEDAASVSDSLFKKEKSYPTRELIQEQKQLKQLVETRKSQQSYKLVTASGSSSNIDVKIGHVINVTGFKDEDMRKGKESYGKYIIQTVTHHLSGDGNYQNNFSAFPSSIPFPPNLGNYPLPFCENQHAIIDDNHDPDQLGRVKVKFPWMGDSDTTPWTRVIQSHAGSNKGFYIMPEIGDQVLVGFEHDNPDKPIVLGSMYHGSTKPGQWADPDNYKKAIRTMAGNEIVLLDEGGKEEILISNPDGKNTIKLSLDGSGSITIDTCGDLNISAADNISMTAGKNISITAGDKMSLSSKNMETKTDQNTTMNAGKNMDLSCTSEGTFAATGNLSLSGMNANLEGKMDVNVKGGKAANVSATMTNVDGTAKTTVKGAIVQLN